MDLLAYNPSQDVLSGLRHVFELEGQRIKQVSDDGDDDGDGDGDGVCIHNCSPWS